MVASDPICVAIVGGGLIAPFHAKWYAASPSYNLVAIIDPFSSKLAEELSVGHFKTVAELTSSDAPKPDLYLICVPSSLHVQLAIEVLETASTAKVILVEKPLSTDSASAEKLLALARDKDVIIAVGHHRRFHPAVKTAKRAISDGKLGKLTAISGLWACKKNNSYFNVKWRCSRLGGGGPIWTNFVHDIDLLHYMVGSYAVRIWVTSTVQRRIHSDVAANDGVEEGAAIMFLFANGIVGTFVVSDNVSSPFGWELASGENPLFPKAEPAVDCFRVFGTEGTMTVPDGNLWTYSRDEARTQGVEVGWGAPMTREVLEIPAGVPFQDQAEHLARVINEQEQPLCSGTDGLVAVRVCEAIIKALDNGDGHPVDIE